MIVPLKVAAGVDRRKEVRVTVENNTKGAATANIGLKVPAGWRVTPASSPISLAAGRGDDDGALHGDAARGAARSDKLALKAEATARQSARTSPAPSSSPTATR